jgi:hypothetical protein
MDRKEPRDQTRGNEWDKIALRYLTPQVADTVHIPVTAAVKKKVSHNSETVKKG